MFAAQLRIECHLVVAIEVFKRAHQRPEQRDEIEVRLDEMHPLDAAFARPANLGKYTLQAKIAIAELAAHVPSVQTKTTRVWAPAGYLDHQHAVGRHLQVSQQIRRWEHRQVAKWHTLRRESNLAAGAIGDTWNRRQRALSRSTHQRDAQI